MFEIWEQFVIFHEYSIVAVHATESHVRRYLVNCKFLNIISLLEEPIKELPLNSCSKRLSFLLGQLFDPSVLFQMP